MFSLKPNLRKPSLDIRTNAGNEPGKLELRVLSLNISGANCSAQAAYGLSEKHRLVAQEVLRHSPDVVALQEVFLHTEDDQQPAAVGRLDSLLNAAGFTRKASVWAHCGMSVLYLHARVRRRARSIAAFHVGPVAAVELEVPLAPPDGPGAAAASGAGGGGSDSLQQCGGQPIGLCIGGCHLAPFKEGAWERLQQVQAFLAEAARRNATHVVLAGDTNMRKEENKDVLGLGLQDAHLATGQQRSNAFTWDTTDRTNNKYYGDDTKSYTARYDRLLCSENVDVMELLRVADTALADGSYLSDHFGILCTVLITK